MQLNKLIAVLLLITLCKTFALKGKRSLKVEDGSKNKRKGPINLSGKKCKKHLPKGDKEDEEDNIDYHEEVDCPLVITKSDCDGLRSGKIPSSDGTAFAALNLEITTKSDDAIEQLDRALDEAALIGMKCPVYGSNRELQEMNDPPIEISLVTLDGYSVGELRKASSVNCTKGKKDCTVYQTPFTMYYSGDATPAHVDSFASSLEDAAKRKVDDDEYRKVATVHHVYVDESSLSLIVESKSLVRSIPVGVIAGATVGALALLGSIAGLLYTKKRTGSFNPFSKS